MAVIFGPSPVTLRVNSNPNTSTGLAFADNVIELRATLAHWNGTATARIAVEMSFDAGATWQEFVANGPTIAPSGGHLNQLNLIVGFVPWKVCGFVFPADSRYRPGEVCSELYQFGQPMNGQTTNHSDWAHQDTTPLQSLDQINFHDPDLTPAAGPLRQVRATMIVSGNVNSQLTVEGF